jgi:hypothetical protein
VDDPSCSSTVPSTSIQYWLTVQLPKYIASCYDLLVSLFYQCCAFYLMNWACSSLCWCYDAVLTIWHGCQILPSELGSASSRYDRTTARLKVMKSLHAALEATGWWPRNWVWIVVGPKQFCYPWHQDQLWGLLVAYLVGTGGALPVWEVDISLSSNSARTNAAIPLFSWCA